MAPNAKPNIILFGIDSLLADHMSCYGYERLTSPYLDRFASQGVLFENTYSAHIPTTSAYASMLTGLDVFSTQVVALRHQGPLRPEVKTLAEILRDEGYHTVCVGFDGNSSTSRSCPRSTACSPPTSRFSSSCATWTRTRPTCRPSPTSACSTTATNATPTTGRWIRL